jgi:hypothetical protein
MHNSNVNIDKLSEYINTSPKSPQKKENLRKKEEILDERKEETKFYKEQMTYDAILLYRVL